MPAKAAKPNKTKKCSSCQQAKTRPDGGVGEVAERERPRSLFTCDAHSNRGLEEGEMTKKALQLPQDVLQYVFVHQPAAGEKNRIRFLGESASLRHLFCLLVRAGDWVGSGH
jgi:hypothetical protein